MAVLDLVAGTLQYRHLLRSQYWSPLRLERYTETWLHRTLEAAARIPFYRQRFGRGLSLETFPDIPILKRSEVPELNRSVRSLSPSSHRFAAGLSSGSTGMPAEFIFSRDHQQSRFSARIRYLLSNGWRPGPRSVWISSLPKRGPDSKLMSLFRRFGTTFLSVFTPPLEQVNALAQCRPHYLYTYPSNYGALLNAFEQLNLPVPLFRALFSGGEVLDATIRERVRRSWGLDIHDNYGSTEAFVAWQCPQGGYHLNAEHVFVEFVDSGGHPVARGEVGRLLLTTLHNELMPLVRYEIGDYSEMAARPCPCGRGLPTIGPPIGRSINLFRTTDGRLASPWELVVKIKYLPELRQFQIVQRSVGCCLLRYVADCELPTELQRSIVAAFRATLGDSNEILFERVELIPREKSGKFPVAISEVAQDSGQV